MKSTVNAEAFCLALKKAYQACARKSNVPALMNVAASFQDGVCTLTGSDMEQWCQATVPADGDSFSFGFRNTHCVLTACKHFSGELTLEFRQDPPPAYAPDRTDLPGTLTLHCGGKSCTLRAAPAGELPAVPEVKDPVSYQIDPGKIYQRYKRIKYAISADSRRPTSMCVQFMDDRMVTMSNYRLAYSRDPALHAEKRFYIPPEAMELLPLLGDGDCTLLVGETRAAFESENVRIVTRTPGGEGYNVDASIPAVSREECTVDVDDFLQKIQYLSEFTSLSKREPVRFENGALSITGAESKCGASIELSAPMETVVGFNAWYMLDALKQFKTKKVRTVTMGLTGLYTPILLTDDDGDLAMVLPVRLSVAAKAA